MPTQSTRRLRPKLFPNETFFLHCVSRVVDKRFIFQEEEKAEFLSLVRRYEAFGKVRVVGYCIMSNHFHVLVEASGRPEVRPGEVWLLEHVEATLGPRIAGQYKARLDQWRELAAEQLALREAAAAKAKASNAALVETKLGPAEEEFEAVLDGLWRRMYDVSSFILSVKQQFSHWYNKRMERTGTLWEDRFKSTLVQGGSAVAEMAAYIDLNPVRAGLVSDPKDYAWSQYGAAVAGDAVAKAGVLYVAQFYASLTGEELADWSAGQGRYRILMYRRGLVRVLPGGRTEGVFSAAEVEQVYEEGGRIPHLAEPSGISYVNKKIRYFTDAAVFGGKEFVERIFQENRAKFGRNRATGARKLRPAAGQDWGSLRVLRDLQK